jgi:hypothetical protein
MTKKQPLFDEVVQVPLPLEKWIDITLTCNMERYELKVGDQGFVLGTAPGKGGISFGSYKQPFAIDDFKLTYSRPEELSANLLINSSFEYATNSDSPDSWVGIGERYRTNGLSPEICTAAGIKEFREKFYLDQTQAYNGKRSMRLESPFHLISACIGVDPKKDYMVSCYIKSDKDACEVAIGATHDSIGKPVKREIIKVDGSWRRYELPLSDYPKETLSFFVKPLSSGKIWVDAVQLEEGKKATQFNQCWMDTGYNLPYDVNKNQCRSNVNGIKGTLERRDIVSLEKLNISRMKFTSTDPVRHAFSLEFDIENVAAEDNAYGITALITSKTGNEQARTCNHKIPPGKNIKVRFDDLIIDDLRCCVNIVMTNPAGITVKHSREFTDLPQPMRIYPEYSYYTDEEVARIVLQFDAITEKLKNCKLNLETIIGGYWQYPCVRKSFELNPSTPRQFFSIPITRLSPNTYIIKAKVVDQEGKAIMCCEAELVKRSPGKTEVKINRINRGAYVNGKPFLPYGILVPGFGEKQLQYYRECGFSYIQFISHWNSLESNLELLANCERLGIDAIAFHLSRPFLAAPYEIAAKYRASPAFVGIVPSDESSDRMVYEEAGLTKQACPERLIWVNHHFHSYRTFANRIDGFPGDVLSIDRYPFIMHPPGRPQTTNDMYSIEQCMEMMDRDGVRERKPVFLWLQGAGQYLKEPTPQQLTWQTYIPMVNHCMGFTYFGGIPNSGIAWERMMELNREIQTLKPALFSLEDEPKIIAVDQTSRENIRFMAKKLGNELTVICVNRTLYPVDATLDFSAGGIKDSQAADVLFENRKLKTDDKGILRDKFNPLERHVYVIRVP